MIELPLFHREAIQNLQRWRNRYPTSEYPHIIVKNMMYEGYSLCEIFKEYKNQSLPHFVIPTEAVLYMRDYYGEISKYRINPILDSLLSNKPDRVVAGLTYSVYDRMASSAEVSTSMLEELEFSYVFDFLQTKCVQFWLAFCLSGKSENDAIGMLTGRKPIDEYYYDLSLLKAAFQDLNVKQYLAGFYHPLPTVAKSRNQNSVTFRLEKKIESEFENMSKDSLTYFNPSLYLEDTRFLEKFEKDLQLVRSGNLDNSGRSTVIDNYIASCPHPYACAELSSYFIGQGDYNKASIFLQEIVINSLSVYNPYWHNHLAVCGCADGLLQVMEILGESNLQEFETLTSVSVRAATQLYLMRAIAACEKISPELACRYGVQQKLRRYYSCLRPMEMSANVPLYELYKNGKFALLHNFCAELMRFLRAYRKGNAKSWKDYAFDLAMEASKRKQELPESYKKGYSDLDNRLMAFFEKKEDYDKFEAFLDSKNVKCLYHLTLRKNIDSIIKNNGLYSAAYLRKNGMPIDGAVGNEETRRIDEKNERHNYIRLSLCNDYPADKKRKSDDEDLVLLEVRRDVIWSKGTLFSDRNAVDPTHNEGPNFVDMTRIDFDAAMSHGLTPDDPRYDLHLAEIMVKGYIPISYIQNLDMPDTF